jgi:hypothetical protein
MGSLFTKKKKPIKKEIELDIDLKKPFDVQKACRNVDIITTSELHPDDRLKEGVYVEDDEIKEGVVMANPMNYKEIEERNRAYQHQQHQKQQQDAESRKVAAFRTAYISEGAQLVLKERVMKKFEERFDHGYNNAKGSVDHFKVMFIINGDREREWLVEYIDDKKRWWIVSEHDRHTTYIEYTFHPKELTQI